MVIGIIALGIFRERTRRIGRRGIAELGEQLNKTQIMVFRDVHEIGVGSGKRDGSFLTAEGAAEFEIKGLDGFDFASKVKGTPNAHRRFQGELRREAHDNFIRSGRRAGLVIDERYGSIVIQLDPVRARRQQKDGTIGKTDIEFAFGLGFYRLDPVAAPCFELEIEID